MNKYYHRGQGECVVPTGVPVEYHIASLPVTAYCDPVEPIGWMDEYEERYQVFDIKYDTWKSLDLGSYTKAGRRLFLVRTETKQPDLTMNKIMGGGSWTCEKCGRSIQGSSLIHECKPPTPSTYEQEAEELYPGKTKKAGPHGVMVLKQRTAHITAREMSREELEAKDREIERLKGLLCKSWKGWHIAFYRSTSSMIAREIEELYNEHWQQFKTENNL